MDVKTTFLKLTTKTYPYLYEDDVVKLLPIELNKDSVGNYFYKVGESKSIFTCHLDTASSEQERVTHIIDGDIIKTNGDTILGADDKAGVVVMLYMINNNIPGLYYFFIGEEQGGIGAKGISNNTLFSDYDRIISFDRRGISSIITHQSGIRCCSEEFAYSIQEEFKKNGLELYPDNSGVYTDSYEFINYIPECTNISVGYYNEHTTNEYQNIKYLQKLCEVCCEVSWENLIKIRTI